MIISKKWKNSCCIWEILGVIIVSSVKYFINETEVRSINSDGKRLKKFVDDYFEGNMSRCASALNVSPSIICRVINGKNKPGLKLISRVIQFCDSKNLKHDQYVILS